MANNIRNQRTTHPKHNARRVRVLERWERINHGNSADPAKKDQELLALHRRTSQNMSPRQVAYDRSLSR